MINLSSFIAFHARRTPERIVVIFNGAEISYGALHTRIAQTAGCLRRRA